MHLSHGQRRVSTTSTATLPADTRVGLPWPKPPGLPLAENPRAGRRRSRTRRAAAQPRSPPRTAIGTECSLRPGRLCSRRQRCSLKSCALKRLDYLGDPRATATAIELLGTCLPGRRFFRYHLRKLFQQACWSDLETARPMRCPTAAWPCCRFAPAIPTATPTAAACGAYFEKDGILYQLGLHAGLPDYFNSSVVTLED